MAIIETEVWKRNPDRPGTLIFDSQRVAQDIFNELAAHLKAEGRMPDEYFLFDRDWKDGKSFPKDADIYCNVNYGGSEGVYLDISVSYKKDVYERNQNDGELGWVNRTVRETFATGKTLGDRIEDLDKMNLVASSVMAAFYGMEKEIRERYAKIESGEIQAVYPIESEEQSVEPIVTSESSEKASFLMEEQEFENKLNKLLPGADPKGIQNLITYAKELEESETVTKSEYFTDTFTEFYLVTQQYGQEKALQLLDVCKEFALNPFELRGAAYHLANGRTLSEISQLAADGECDPPNGEPLSAEAALKAFENGTLHNQDEQQNTSNPSVFIPLTDTQKKIINDLEKRAEKEGGIKMELPAKKSLEDKMKSAQTKADAHNAQNNKSISKKKGENEL